MIGRILGSGKKTPADKRKYYHEYYEKNRDKIRARTKKWREKNGGEYYREYCKKNKEKLRAQKAEWKKNYEKENRALARLKSARYYWARRGYIRQYSPPPPSEATSEIKIDKKNGLYILTFD